MAYLLENDINILKIVRNHQVADSLCKLYLNDDMADVFFVFPNTDDIRRLSAHRLILAAASPVFHQMFYGDLREGVDVIITDCSFDGFSEFLQYFYLNECTLTSDNIFEIIQMANKYDLPNCVNMCIDFLTEYLNAETVFLTLHIAIVYDIKELIVMCERLISSEPMVVFAAEAFVYCSFMVLKRILSLPGIDCTELDLLDAAMLWAKHACFTELDETPSIERCKSKLSDCFKLIRFDTMPSTDFSACLFRYPGMFSTPELERRVIAIETQRSINGPAPRSKHYFNDDGFIVCSRILSQHSTLYIIQPKQIIQFSVSSPIILHSIHIKKQTQVPEFPYKERNPLNGHILKIGLTASSHRAHSQAIEFDLNKDNQIQIRPPVLIHANRDYNISLTMNTNAVHFSTVELKKDKINVGKSIEFTFKQNEDANYDTITRGLISELWFKLP